MGHSSKKKKRSGGGRKAKGRAPLKDNSSQADNDQDTLSEELTALEAIFEEDIKIVLDSSQTQLAIKLRPYSTDMGLEDNDVSALLIARCLPGYPHKSPKLQIVPEKGLSKEDADQLLSLLVDQANINSREGRVMIYNLVETAQEFLSEIAPVERSNDSVLSSSTCKKLQSLQKDARLVGEKSCNPEEFFVSGSIDLFSDLCGGDDGSWGGSGTKIVDDDSNERSKGQPTVVDRRNSKSFMLSSQISLTSRNVVSDNHLFQHAQPGTLHVAKHGAAPRTIKELNIFEEETKDDSKSVPSHDFDVHVASDSSGKGSDNTLHEDLNLEEQTTIDGYDSERESLSSSAFVSVTDEDFQINKKELLLVHLLRLVCSSHGSLAYALPDVSSELYSSGLLSVWARDLAAEPPSVFNKTFHHAFEQHMTSSRFSQFWKAAVNYGGESASVPNSRYLNDFEEVQSLGHGGFGHVVLCKNKLDGRLYAVKKIRLKNPHVNDKMLREVATLSRLQHQHVVRYYQAWFETEYGDHHGNTTLDSMTAESTSCSYLGTSLTNAAGPDISQESTYLYIQMEYCPRTLHQEFESNSALFGKEYVWHLFRQIVEGLAHIHSQGIIHRDLTPSNIFFDVRNDIKIGDFGLAKFLKLEQLDHEQYFPTEATGASIDGTGQVGTYFYTAPEIEQRWPQINEKVDMYSLGVVFFELWHPFATAMERHIVLTDLKQKGSLPPSWVAKFSDQAILLRRLMSPSPSDRPSAIELLQHALPPRMEDEWLNDILRTIQTAEDTYVYDRVVSAIFDEKRFITKASRQHVGSAKVTRGESSVPQTLDLDTELRDNVIEVTKEVFKQHGARRLEMSPMHVFDGHHIDRKAVKLLTRGGNMLELCHDLRSPFVDWMITNQKTSLKCYEISRVYRRAVGRSTPNHFLQGDFDIIGGEPPLTEAEAIKVGMDIATRFFHSNAIDIHLSHGHILEAIWAWVGIEGELRQNVAELLSLVSSSCPQSTRRKTNWGFIRRQLIQDLNLPEAIVDKLQTADLRFCGPADQALARLRGALSPSKFTRKALEELSSLLHYLRIWGFGNHISIDILMPPTESYFRGLFFQIYIKENHEATLLAVGGRYDHLVNQKWDQEFKSSPPGAVGISLALEKILLHSSVEIRPFRNEANINVLVCSRGGGGLLPERMQLVTELWQANIKAEFVATLDPSLTEQYEYAAEHDIKCLIIITEAGIPETGLVKVRHLELKKEKEIERGELIKFLMDAISTQFRNLVSRS